MIKDVTRYFLNKSSVRRSLILITVQWGTVCVFFFCRCAMALPPKTLASTTDVEKKQPIEATEIVEEVRKPLTDDVNEEDPPIIKT